MPEMEGRMPDGNQPGQDQINTAKKQGTVPVGDTYFILLYPKLLVCSQTSLLRRLQNGPEFFLNKKTDPLSRVISIALDLMGCLASSVISLVSLHNPYVIQE